MPGRRTRHPQKLTAKPVGKQRSPCIYSALTPTESIAICLYRTVTPTESTNRCIYKRGPPRIRSWARIACRGAEPETRKSSGRNGRKAQVTVYIQRRNSNRINSHLSIQNRNPNSINKSPVCIYTKGRYPSRSESKHRS